MEIRKPGRDVKSGIYFTFIFEKPNKKVLRSKSTGLLSVSFKSAPTGKKKKNDKKSHKLQKYLRSDGHSILHLQITENC